MAADSKYPSTPVNWPEKIFPDPPELERILQEQRAPSRNVFRWTLPYRRISTCSNPGIRRRAVA